jgi:ATP-dependent exoDNAse (exonuclease V) alpha subunit
VDAVNLAIRAKLRENGFLGEGVALIGYRAVDHTVAEKQDAGTFPVGTKVFFLRRYSRYLRGDICTVVEAAPRGLTLLRGGRKGRLAYRYADSVTVLRERPIELAPGDRIQIKWNGRSLDDKPLVNGELATIRRIHADGQIEIESDRGQEKILGPHQRLFNYGYACTSYASQGKTVDTVLFSDAGSRPATNQKQWFVTISRARRRVLVFTPDKPALRSAIAAEGHRPLASEAKRGGRAVSGYLMAVIPATMPAPSGPNQGAGIRR